MKNIFKYIGLTSLFFMSFYYTEKVALYVKNQNPLMQEIKSNKEAKYVSSINSTLIDELYIIPGLNGKEVNVDKSFSNMLKLEAYNEEEFVYNQITPSISLEKNKNRIIIRGNPNKRSISIIFEEESNLSKYMSEKGYKVNMLIKNQNYYKNYEMINNSNNENEYKSIDKYLNKSKLNKNLCYVKEKIPTICKDKYLFKTSLTINHSNISSEIKKISSGEIILIQNTLTLAELEVILNQIKYQDLNIVPLSELISEYN